jgi:hypothetical protein
MKLVRIRVLKNIQEIIDIFAKKEKSEEVLECLKVYRRVLAGESCPHTVIQYGKCAFCKKSMVIKSIEDLPPMAFQAIRDRKNRDWSVSDFIKGWNEEMKAQQSEDA